MTPPLDPDVFVRAAELIDSGEYRFSCWAITNGIIGLINSNKTYFIEYFKPIDTKSAVWMNTETAEENKSHRVIALLLTAEILESELDG